MKHQGQYMGGASGRKALFGAVALASVVGCSTSSRAPLITGKAHVDATLPAGECRRMALEGARTHAYEQILRVVCDESSTGGESIAGLMKQSAYVDARVRRAIQKSRVHEALFYDDGHAVVVLEMDLPRICEEARKAHSELQ